MRARVKVKGNELLFRCMAFNQSTALRRDCSVISFSFLRRLRLSVSISSISTPTRRVNCERNDEDDDCEKFRVCFEGDEENGSTLSAAP